MKSSYFRHLSDEEETAVEFEKIRKKSDKEDNRQQRTQSDHNRRTQAKSFKCLHCGSSVSTERKDSGVNNRNHCPHCLWSRHVDLNKAGDRKAECRSRMQPVGLTIKRVHKQYDRNAAGELMVIHQCTGCGKISINRIAADDDAAGLYQVFEESQGLDLESRTVLESGGILLLGRSHLTTVYSQLFGWPKIVNAFVTRDETHDDLRISDGLRESIDVVTLFIDSERD